MSFYEIFMRDIEKLTARYPFFEMIAVDENILTKTANMNIDDQTKCAILAIDTSMRMQDLVTDDNKDCYVLSTDLLSALFYQYLASPFHQHHYQVLTECVAKQNELKQQYADTKDQNLKNTINNIFIAPFIAQ
ncbi:hypothetical protein [Macrococcus animalis]|uniref:hypothetical protein n=1 Tax=Macrococcus animalis TaxID=3395467 RepID=UPI0039BDE9CD